MSTPSVFAGFCPKNTRQAIGAGAFCESGGQFTPSVFCIKKAAFGGKSLFLASKN
jgi:hypothetical protein